MKPHNACATDLPNCGSDRNSPNVFTERFLVIPNEGEFIGALRKVIAAFESLEIQYALGGSFASSFYGEARATRDVDLIAAVTGKHAAPLVAALGPEFYADEPQIL